MVVIRLQRGGANKRPFYHLVVADSRRAASGKFLERVGFYDPKAPEGREALRVDMERVKHWTGQGAQLSGTAARLVKQFAKKAAWAGVSHGPRRRALRRARVGEAGAGPRRRAR